MKSYEKETLIKNFFLSFLLMLILLIILFWKLFEQKEREFDHSTLQQMELCAYTLDCSEFRFDFVELNRSAIRTLRKDDQSEVTSFFLIPESDNYMLKISLDYAIYQEELRDQLKSLGLFFFLMVLLLSLLVYLSTLYSLKPLREALRLNDEFVKDILHDFNTPLAAIKLNVSLLKKKFGTDRVVQNIEKSITQVLALQNNLKCFLMRHPTQADRFDLVALLKERIEHFALLYPSIDFQLHFDTKTFYIYSNKGLVMRIVDNLLSNAAKYNKRSGKVIVRLLKNRVIIEDTGKGIANPDKVMQRFYKEQERGVGLGLSIVHKLCMELGIAISIESKKGQGTKVRLDFSSLSER